MEEKFKIMKKLYLARLSTLTEYLCIIKEILHKLSGVFRTYYIDSKSSLVIMVISKLRNLQISLILSSQRKRHIISSVNHKLVVS